MHAHVRPLWKRSNALFSSLAPEDNYADTASSEIAGSDDFCRIFSRALR